MTWPDPFFSSFLAIVAGWLVRIKKRNFTSLRALFGNESAIAGKGGGGGGVGFIGLVRCDE